MNQLEVVSLRELNTLHATLLLATPDNMLFTYDGEMRLMREEAEHDQVCIRPVETVSSVGIIAFTVAQLANKV